MVLENDREQVKILNALLLKSLVGLSCQQDEEDIFLFREYAPPGYRYLFAKLLNFHVIGTPLKKPYGGFKILSTEELGKFVENCLKMFEDYFKKDGLFLSVAVVNEKCHLVCEFSESNRQFIENTYSKLKYTEISKNKVVIPLSELVRDGFLEEVEKKFPDFFKDDFQKKLAEVEKSRRHSVNGGIATQNSRSIEMLSRSVVEPSQRLSVKKKERMEATEESKSANEEPSNSNKETVSTLPLSDKELLNSLLKEAFGFLKKILYLPCDLDFSSSFSIPEEFDDAQKTWLLNELNFLQDNGFLKHDTKVSANLETEDVSYDFKITSIDVKKIERLKLSLENNTKNDCFDLVQRFNSHRKLAISLSLFLGIPDWQVSLSGSLLSGVIQRSSGGKVSKVFENANDGLMVNCLSGSQAIPVSKKNDKNKYARFFIPTESEGLKDSLKEVVRNAQKLVHNFSFLLEKKLNYVAYSPALLEATLGLALFVTEDQKQILETFLGESVAFVKYDQGFLLYCHNFDALEKRVIEKYDNFSNSMTSIVGGTLVSEVKEVPKKIVDDFEQVCGFLIKFQVLPILKGELEDYHQTCLLTMNPKSVAKVCQTFDAWGLDCIDYEECQKSSFSKFFKKSDTSVFKITVKKREEVTRKCNEVLFQEKTEKALPASHLSVKDFTSYKSAKW